jgi:hypothetical protein
MKSRLYRRRQRVASAALAVAVSLAWLALTVVAPAFA